MSDIAAPSIKDLFQNQRYETDELSTQEKKYIEKHAPKKRIARSDLQLGDLVVVLEGAFTSKKVVFIKQLPNFMALVSGIPSINGVGTFKIDERYLFKLNSKLNFQVGNISEDVYESRIDESVESATSIDKDLELSLIKSVKSIDFMRAYLAEPFSIDHSGEFYSFEY